MATQGFALPTTRFADTILSRGAPSFSAALTANFEYLTWYMNTYVAQLTAETLGYNGTVITAATVGSETDVANPADGVNATMVTTANLDSASQSVWLDMTVRWTMEALVVGAVYELRCAAEGVALNTIQIQNIAYGTVQTMERRYCGQVTGGADSQLDLAIWVDSDGVADVMAWEISYIIFRASD